MRSPRAKSSSDYLERCQRAEGLREYGYSVERIAEIMVLHVSTVRKMLAAAKAERAERARREELRREMAARMAFVAPSDSRSASRPDGADAWVEEAKRLRAKGWSVKGLARRFDVSEQRVAAVLGVVLQVEGV